MHLNLGSLAFTQSLHIPFPPLSSGGQDAHLTGLLEGP